MNFLNKIRSWWRGNRDPQAAAEGERIRQEVETQRTGGLTGPPNLTHRGGSDRFE
jgi:hypothetical protein